MRQNILKNIVNTLQMEAEGILSSISHVDEQYNELVHFIYNQHSKVIISGIGKSAIIAQKIVATLNSTGQPSVFLHAADAIHGDLGLISENDIVWIISKSGETPEIKVLTQIVKGYGNKIIGMTCNNTSYLAKLSDFVIYLPLHEEADPNRMAPTVSTTQQLAMGDAIAMALVSLRGFTQDDFAKYHPGGSLGKSMYLTVDALAAKNEKPMVVVNDTISTCIMQISAHRLGATVVLDERGKIKGIITDGDIRRMLQNHTTWQKMRALDIMTPLPITVSTGTLAIEALNLMKTKSISQVIIDQDGHYYGIVHIQDILKEGIV